jgi:hypothetical protein
VLCLIAVAVYYQYTIEKDVVGIKISELKQALSDKKKCEDDARAAAADFMRKDNDAANAAGDALKAEKEKRMAAEEVLRKEQDARAAAEEVLKKEQELKATADTVSRLTGECNATMKSYIDKNWAFDDTAKIFGPCKDLPSRWYRGVDNISLDGVKFGSPSRAEAAYGLLRLS